MNLQVKSAWIYALKSGKYKQGKRSLLTIDPKTGEQCFCLLGVLTDLYHTIMERGQWDRTSTLIDGETPFITDGSSMDFITLPKAVMDWAGLRSFNPVIALDGKRLSLAQLNDGNLTFPELAKIVEENL